MTQNLMIMATLIVATIVELIPILTLTKMKIYGFKQVQIQCKECF